MVGSESDSISGICCEIKSTKNDFCSPIQSRQTRQLPGLHASDQNTLRHCQAAQKTQVWLPENFRFFYTMKIFEQTVESELEDSLGEYEIAAEKNSRDRRADVVCDVICDITPMKCQLLGPRMEKKNGIMIGEIWRSPGSCQGHCQESVRVTKTLCAITRPRRPRSGYPRTSRSTPGQSFVSPPPHQLS